MISETLISKGYCLRMLGDLVGALTSGKQAEASLWIPIPENHKVSPLHLNIRNKLWVKLSCFMG